MNRSSGLETMEESRMDQLVLNVPLVEQVLFEKADKLAGDYGLNPNFDSPHQFIDALVHSMDQHGLDDPTSKKWRPSDVFRAAVRALGSNQTVWVRYLEAEGGVATVLHGFDPDAVAEDIERGEAVRSALATALPSTTPRCTASDIVAWAQLLHDQPDFFADVQALGAAVLNSGVLSQSDELLPVVATVLSTAGQPRRCREALASLGAPERKDWKLQGMGFALASEFLRNVQWRGFKPDTHVKRLFDRWLEDRLGAFEERATELAAVVGVRSKEACENIQYSLAGLSITPPGESPSKIDNLVWLVGANIETKRHSTDRNYLTRLS